MGWKRGFHGAVAAGSRWRRVNPGGCREGRASRWVTTSVPDIARRHAVRLANLACCGVSRTARVWVARDAAVADHASSRRSVVGGNAVSTHQTSDMGSRCRPSWKPRFQLGRHRVVMCGLGGWRDSSLKGAPPPILLPGGPVESSDPRRGVGWKPRFHPTRARLRLFAGWHSCSGRRRWPGTLGAILGSA